MAPNVLAESLVFFQMVSWMSGQPVCELDEQGGALEMVRLPFARKRAFHRCSMGTETRRDVRPLGLIWTPVLPFAREDEKPFFPLPEVETHLWVLVLCRGKWPLGRAIVRFHDCSKKVYPIHSMGLPCMIYYANQLGWFEGSM